jgi:uncharacterized protein YcbX
MVFASGWAIAKLLRAIREDDRVLVTSLLIYPVKSMGGVAVDTAGIEPWGIAGDRRWGLIDEDGQKITAREHWAGIFQRSTLYGSSRLWRAETNVR